MVARQLSFKHVLRGPLGVNSSFLVHTEYFVVFWRRPALESLRFRCPFEGEKSFLSKGKERSDVCLCDINAVALLRLTRRYADICSAGGEPACGFWHFRRASDVSGRELRGNTSPLAISFI